MSCLGCEAKDRELEYLRKQCADAQDRVFAMANPTGYQIYKGIPLDQVSGQTGDGQAPVFRGEDGIEYLFVGGQRVPAEEYYRMQERLENQMSGRSAHEAASPDLQL